MALEMTLWLARGMSSDELLTLLSPQGFTRDGHRAIGLGAHADPDSTDELQQEMVADGAGVTPLASLRFVIVSYDRFEDRQIILVCAALLQEAASDGVLSFGSGQIALVKHQGKSTLHASLADMASEIGSILGSALSMAELGTL